MKVMNLFFEQAENILVVVTVFLEYLAELNEHRQGLNSRGFYGLLCLDGGLLL